MTASVAAVLRSEWTKAYSLRSTRMTVLAGFVITVGLGLVSGFSVRAAIDRDDPMLVPDFDAAVSGFDSLLYGQLVYVAFAVLVVSSEYGSGTIRPSLAAVPRRGLFYGAKIAVVGLVAVMVGLVTVFVSVPSTQAAFGPYGVPIDAQMVGAMLGGAGSVILLCLFAAGVAAMLRNTALTLGVLLPFFFVASPVLGGLTATRDVARFLPDQAGLRLMRPGTEGLSPGIALLVMLGWAAAAVLGGHLATRGRDV